MDVVAAGGGGAGPGHPLMVTEAAAVMGEAATGAEMRGAQTHTQALAATHAQMQATPWAHAHVQSQVQAQNAQAQQSAALVSSSEAAHLKDQVCEPYTGGIWSRSIWRWR